MKKEIKHDHKCSKCGEVAEYNLHNVDVLYKVDEEGNFKGVDKFSSPISDFYCEKCAKKERLI